MNRRRRFFVQNTLTFLDGLVIAFSYFLTYYLRNQFLLFGLEDLFPFSVYFPYLAPIMVIWLLLLRLFDNYAFLRTSGALSHWRLFGNLIPVELIGLSAITMILFFLRDTSISRSFLILFTAVNYVCLVLLRQLVFIYFKRMDRVRKYHRRALLIGHGKVAERFLEIERRMPELLFDVIVKDEFLISVDQEMEVVQQERLFEGILDYVWYNVVDEVILAFNDIEPKLFAPFINECNRMGIVVNIVFDTSNITYWKSEIDRLGPFNIISFQTYDYNPLQRALKRLIDMFFGLIGCTVLCIIFPFVAAAIKINDPGPVFFLQTRKGKNGREFKMIKFRSMYTDAEERKKELMEKNELRGHVFKLQDDPRVTPVGRFLRKTSIDEIPQFVNILKGEMSLVGTRPPTVEEFEAYEPRHRRRLSVQPGLTGLWQVSGRNKITDFEEIVKLDTQYIDNWNLWLDLKIIAKTFFVLFTGR
ncbi:MAG TPA: sugar transferase [Sediminispirochaeta sp.]|nr:sugar transferase [Sediminispirochaeta sp.]